MLLLLFVGAATDCKYRDIKGENSHLAHTVVGGLSSMTEVAGITLNYCFLSFTLKLSARRRSQPGASETEIVRKIKWEKIGLGVVFAVFAVGFVANFTYWQYQLYDCRFAAPLKNCATKRYIINSGINVVLDIILLACLGVSVRLMKSVFNNDRQEYLDLRELGLYRTEQIVLLAISYSTNLILKVILLIRGSREKFTP